MRLQLPGEGHQHPIIFIRKTEGSFYTVSVSLRVVTVMPKCRGDLWASRGVSEYYAQVFGTPPVQCLSGILHSELASFLGSPRPVWNFSFCEQREAAVFPAPVPSHWCHTAYDYSRPVFCGLQVETQAKKHGLRNMVKIQSLFCLLYFVEVGALNMRSTLFVTKF